MKIKTILFTLLIAFSLSACKVLKTHIIKVTSSAELHSDAILLKTTKGYVYLASQQMTEKEKTILQSLLPFQCLEIKTPEQFDMQNREVRFEDFKIRKLVANSPECRKIKVTTRIEIH